MVSSRLLEAESPRLPRATLRPDWPAAVSLLALVLILAGCDRPFREVEPPSITVVDPDVTEVLRSSVVPITVSTESFRTVDRLEIDGEVATFDSVSGYWRDTLGLSPGLNTFVLQAFDVEGVVRVDTLHLVHLEITGSSTSESLPEPRGGHTATLLPDGRVLVLGGAETSDGAGLPDGFILFPPFGAERLLSEMNVGRIGHTASLLPDGRVLIVGGSRFGIVAQLSDLVETVEIYDPSTGRFTTIPVEGSPIRRAYHSAVVYQEDSGVIIDLYGGRGDVSFGAGGSLGTRRDVRSFLLRGDTLRARTSEIGGVLLDPLAGHTQTSLTNASRREDDRSLIVGSRFAGGDFETVAMVLDYTVTSRFLNIVDVGPVQRPRTQHAAVDLRRAMVLFLGGRQETAAAIVRRSELYIHATGRFYAFQEGILDQTRFGHTATKLSDGRILVTGGFGPDTEALSEVSVYTTRL